MTIDRGTVHVFPTRDLVEHDTDTDQCVCGPALEAVARGDGTYGWVYVHHALDGREFSEHDYTGVPMRREP